LIPYGRHYIDDEDIAEVIKVLKSDFITQGPKIKEFEDALCKYTGAKYAVAVSSGTAALHLACLASGIGSGDEVITSPITFVASANCVLYCGGIPLFVDIQNDTLNIDPEKIISKITNKTRAIIPVHFAGHPCDLEEIHSIAKKYRLFVIEDACHALGAEYRGTKIGSCQYSDMTVFSFHPVKSITTGEGGAILTNNETLYEKLLTLRTHGITKDKEKWKAREEGDWYYEMQYLGYNYRITDFQCALGISQLRKLDRFISRRREIARIYTERLSRVEGIILPVERQYVKSAWHLYTIRLNKSQSRADIFKYLREQGIGVQVHYIPVYLHPYYKQKFNFKVEDFPVAQSYYSSSISIPIFYSMRDDEIEYVISKIESALYEKFSN